MQVKEIISVLENAAPPALQESYDNCGLCTGTPDNEVNAVLVTVDITEKVVDEAISKKADMIVSHHPIIFHGLKKLTGANEAERCVIKAIQNNISIYCAHTSFDNAFSGVNAALAEKIGVKNYRILSPAKQQLCKLVTFVPTAHAEKVQQALFDAGAGHIGNYDNCSFKLEGEGTFRGGENTKPFVGEKGKLHHEPEVRIETIFPKYIQREVVNALLKAHPYEEAAYDIYLLENKNPMAGSGMIGELEKPLSETDFLSKLKASLGAKQLRHTALGGRRISKVALCGGSGAFLTDDALQAGADAFVTADLKYHQFQEAENRLLLIDAGHFETEEVTKNIFYTLITKKFPTFAVHFSETITNPVNFF
jgi:dinuclear metal center YbgI/SA1388 family protein